MLSKEGSTKEGKVTMCNSNINEEIEKVISDLEYFTYGDSDDLYSHYIVCETAQSAIDLIKKLAKRIGI